MKVLILSCNTGGGHNAAASALKESLNFYHHEAEVLDLMSLGRKHTSALVGGAYVKLVSVFPAGFGALYQLGELVRKFPWKSPVYYANARLGNALADYIDQNHFNAVVTTHLYPAETLTWMKQKGRLTIPCVAVATDYACIPFWEETNCDYYVVPHKDLIPEFASCGIPEEKLLPLGIPVRPAFARPASKEDVRRHLGLPENAPLFLVMSGSMGFGKVHLLAHELVSRLENGEQAVIICGNNKKRMRSLRLQFHKNPNVHIIGFTRHVAEYMAAADVLFTKPGGLSSTEAAVRRVPLVHTDPIPGCETKNRAFFVSRGMSVTGAHQKELAEAGISLACDDARQIAMRDAQHQNSHPQAGTSITHLLEKLVSEKLLMMLTAYLFYSFFGYLSGSVLYSYLIPKYFCHVDVRTVNEDQNPGAFNAFSVAGLRIGLLCVLCDIGKGFLPVFLAAHSSAVSMSSWIFALILLAPVAGHAWPFLQPAKGGKAISVSFGVLLGLLPDLRPALLLAAFYLTFSLILIIQPHNLRSIVSFSGFAVAAQISRFLPSVRLGSLLVSLVVCFRHLFSLREHETENAAFTIQSLSAKIRKKQKKE